MIIRRKEQIISGHCEACPKSCEGVTFRSFASQAVGAAGFSTGMTTYGAGAVMNKRIHDASEAMTILEGTARVIVEDREHTLTPFDCIHVPAGALHCVTNIETAAILRIHSAFGSAAPKSEFTQERFRQTASGETVLRFETCPVYELSPGALFRDLFARRLGSAGICGGYGLFSPGSSLPCHTHKYDESITIVYGEANCLMRGNRYRLSGYDTAFVPEGEPHRFINESDGAMAMIWVYAGDEPDRLLVDNAYCSGALIWPENSMM